MKTAKRIISLIAIGLFPSILLAEGEPPLSASVPQDSDYSISQTELKKGRPANGFKLVYSENDAVCQPVLAALNEPGYDSRYFNQSDKFENTLPELLIQTRLNVPRTLIGTHLYRTEEYEIKDAESGNKEYWYRFIGQGYYIFGEGTGVKVDWMTAQKQPYTDFFDFIDKGLPYPDCYYLKQHACMGARLAQRSDVRYFWESKPFDKFQQATALEFKAPKWLIHDVITLAEKYYLISSDTQLSHGDTVRIGLNDFNGEKHRPGKIVCFFESRFRLIGAKDD